LYETGSVDGLGPAMLLTIRVYSLSRLAYLLA
jgi:hypothetical protein